MNEFSDEVQAEHEEMWADYQYKKRQVVERKEAQDRQTRVNQMYAAITGAVLALGGVLWSSVAWIRSHL